MNNSLRLLLAFIFVFNANIGLAQRPMDINFLNSKLDSIILESNIIYQFLKSKVIAENIAKEQFELNYHQILEVQDDDSVKIKFIDRQRVVVLKMVFHEELKSPIIISNISESLSNFEDSLLQIKYNFLSKIDSSKYGIESHDSEKVVTIIYPHFNRFKLYRILSTSKKNIIPFGNDFLFNLDSEGNLISWKNFHKSYVPMKTTHRGYEVRHIIPKYDKNEAYILATDIALFRLFTDTLELSTFTAYPPKSKRYFTYDSKTNKLRVHNSLTN